MVRGLKVWLVAGLVSGVAGGCGAHGETGASAHSVSRATPSATTSPRSRAASVVVTLPATGSTKVQTIPIATGRASASQSQALASELAQLTHLLARLQKP